MNFQSLFYFKAIQTEGSIQGAAKRLNLSPQALSENVKRLEAEIGVKLLNQTRPVTLTESGLRFGEFVEDILLEKLRMERDLTAINGQKKQLEISTPLRGTPIFLAEAIKAFIKIFPNCVVRVQERPQGLSPSELKKYDLNFSMSLMGSDLEYIKIPLERTFADYSFPDRYCFVAHKSLLEACWGDKLSQQLDLLQETQDIRLLTTIPFIRFSDAEAADPMDKLMAEAQFAPQIIASSDSSELCFALCTSGVGASVIPMTWLKLHTLSDEMYTFVLPQTSSHHNLYLSYKKEKPLSQEEQTFVQLLLEQLSAEPPY